MPKKGESAVTLDSIKPTVTGADNTHVIADLLQDIYIFHSSLPLFFPCIIIIRMDYIIMGISAAVIIAALMCFIDISKKAKSSQKHESLPHKTRTTCPICGSALLEGENLYSRIYRPMTVPDQRCTISGCPHCYPKCEQGIKRVCPVCHKTIPENGYLVAQLFNKPNGKKHVLVTGCTGCLKNAPKNT